MQMILAELHKPDTEAKHSL